MMQILHMSDFHLGKDPKKEKKRLESLAAWINEAKIHINFLVFTGDIIDAPVIKAECDSKLCEAFPTLKSDLHDFETTADEKSISTYNKLLCEVTCEHMKRAGELFLKFIQAIGLDPNHVILCCGNHDRIRFLSDSQFPCKVNKCFSEEKLTKPFEAYDVLCNIINPHLSHCTTDYSYEGFHFVIANTNWKSPEGEETNNMCISCQELSRKIKGLTKSSDYDRSRTFFVAHKPFDDLCETVKYPYNGEKITVRQELEKHVSALLYGDKHSYAVKMNSDPIELMCGLPLSYDGVRYNLLSFDNDAGARSCKYILYN